MPRMAVAQQLCGLQYEWEWNMKAGKAVRVRAEIRFCPTLLEQKPATDFSYFLKLFRAFELLLFPQTAIGP